MGEFWYFGGYQGRINTLRQASKIEGQVFANHLVLRPRLGQRVSFGPLIPIKGCELVRKPDLPFDFYLGACNTFMHPQPNVLLCFDYYHDKTCHR